MDAPFLDLAFYVGVDRIGDAFTSVASRKVSRGPVGGSRIIGLLEREEEVRSVGGTVLVRTEGEDFCGPFRSNVFRLEALGRAIYTAFVGIAESINCLYGAILVEYALEDPEELRRDPRSYAFRDFYLSRSRLPLALVPRLLAFVPPGAYVRELDQGVYVSMSWEFNPEHRSVESEPALHTSTSIAYAIGQALTAS
jgi:hypothetical protein